MVQFFDFTQSQQQEILVFRNADNRNLRNFGTNVNCDLILSKFIKKIGFSRKEKCEPKTHCVNSEVARILSTIAFCDYLVSLIIFTLLYYYGYNFGFTER